MSTDQAPRLVVVEVDDEAQVSAPLGGVHEGPGELVAEVDVVRAASPLPVEARRTALSVVARARVDSALAARPRNRVRHPRARDGVHEGSLAATCIGAENDKGGYD